MPHQIVEYSANLEARVDIAALVAELHRRALATGAFPLQGMRTRAERRALYRLADGQAQHAFVHVTLQLGHGRSLELRREIGERLFGALRELLAPIRASGPLALSLVLEELPLELSWKENNLSMYLQGREDAAAQSPAPPRGTGSLERNLRRAEQLLERFRARPLPHFIGGKPDPGRSGERFAKTSPSDGSPIGEVCAAGAQDVDAACRAAQRAFEDWRRTPGAERRQLLHRLADAIAERAPDLALLESSDCGQPIRFMREAVLRSAENFRYFADRAPSAADGLALPADEHLNYTTRQPLGPVAVITPWNTPLMLSTWKIAPALAAGCTVVHKPAEWSPYSAHWLAELASEAGLPDGVLNCVQGLGEQAGRALCEHPALRAVAFVGGSETGKAIVRQGAATLKRVHLELGGKNPVLVFADADLERALDAVLFMIFSLNGERCTSSSRLLLQEQIREPFLEALLERVGALRVGHPLDPATELGPLVHEQHLRKLCSYVERGLQEGAQLAIGGKPLPGPGYYVQPTVFTGASARMAIAREEIFGPVLTVIPFREESEAIAIANDTPYGLAAYAWTRELGRAQRLARELDAGMIWINSENRRHLPTPFGGMKESGIGRDGGDYSFDFYMETKNVCLAHGSHRIPALGRG